MKMVYVANVRMPTEKAHGIQIMKMCEAFVKQGIDLELIVPKRNNTIQQDAFSYFGIEKNFKITYIWNIDSVRFGYFGLLLQELTFSINAWLFTRKSKGDLFFSRDLVFSFLKNIFSTELVCYEMHDFPKRCMFIYKYIFRAMNKIISTNNWKKNELISRFGVKDDRILVSFNGFDIGLFNNLPSSTEIRKLLGLPLEKKIILYTGSLMKWKGVELLAQAADFLRDDIVVLIIASSNNVEEFKRRYESSKVVFYNKVAHNKVPLYLKAADVLVLPNVPISEESVHSTSPIKLFEYMASGVPIVASALPSIKEVINSEMAELFNVESVKNLTIAINNVFSDPATAKSRSEKALLAVNQFSWHQRARSIISFLS